MKNSKFSKICLWTLAFALLLTAFVGISVQADETSTAPVIESKNVSYEGALHLYYAIPVTENVKAANTVVNVYKTNPDTDASAELIGTFSGSERYIEVLGGNYIEIRTQGISAKNIADYVYAQPVSGGVAGKVTRYSVAEYLYERLYISEDSTPLQKKLYNSTLQYGIDAQAVLAPTATPIADYNYVYAKDSTIDAEGNNSGLYLDGASLALTCTADGALKGWNLKTLGENGEFAESTQTANTITVNATTIISPDIFVRENKGETFDMAFKDSARENISLPDTGKTYYNNNIFAEKASSNVNAIMYFGIAKDPTDSTNNVLRITKDYGETATAYQSYLTFNTPTTNNFDTVVFEADIYNDFSDKSTSSVTQYDFRNGSTEGVTVLLGADYENLSVRVLGRNAEGSISTNYEAVDGILCDANWYTLKIEYEIIDATAGTTETRVYINGNLVKQVNYVNTTAPLTNVTNMIVRTYSGAMGDFYMDNVVLKKVVAADEARPAYNFDENTLPAGVTTTGDFKVNKGQLVANTTIGSTDTATFTPTEAQEGDFNTVVWSADIKGTSTALQSGNYSEIAFYDADGNRFAFNIMFRGEPNPGSAMYFKSIGWNPKIEVTDVRPLSGYEFNLRVEYYRVDGIGRVDIYVNGQLAGATITDSTQANPLTDGTKVELKLRDGDSQIVTVDNVRLYKINKTR
ncbi:MAG: hypothetical protein J6D20_00800 [Clostridia bacterium]|nr:hypothetical protein [Clostridia bacterium]